MGNSSPYWVKVRGAPLEAWSWYQHKQEDTEGRFTTAARVWKGPFEVLAATFQGAVEVKITKKGEVEWCKVSLIPWPVQGGRGQYLVLYNGPIEAMPEEVEQLDLFGEGQTEVEP